MRSLFLKVFLWFWLAMALVILALVLTTELTRTRDTFPRDSLIDKYTVFIAQNAAHTYEREGAAGLASFLQELERRTDSRTRLFDARGMELSGLGAEAAMADFAPRVAGRDAGPVRSQTGPRALVGFPVITASGNRYVLIVQPAPRPPPPFENLWSLIPRILAVLLTAGLLCYLLARYIVSPVVKLRAVTREVASGHLSARVGPLLGGRRDELADMGRDFDQMAAQIERLMTSQQRLLRDISHELRSPLARLNVALDLARKRSGDRSASALERIEREAQRLNEMIGQLLTLVRWESSSDGGGHEKIDLCHLVREIANDADFEARAQNRSVTLLKCDECRTSGTAALLRSAIENVVRNGVRYTREGTVVEISLACHDQDGQRRAVIKVRDDGPGVPEEMLDDIFRPFYRVEEARDKDSGGTGLGLAIAERAINLHHGTIRAANGPRGGFEVEITLPLLT